MSTLTKLLNISSFYTIAFSVTWISPSQSNSKLNFTNYIVYRCNRSSYNSSSNRGVGVLIAIKSTLKCKVLNVSVNCVERVFVQLNSEIFFSDVFIFHSFHLLNYTNDFSKLLMN